MELPITMEHSASPLSGSNCVLLVGKNEIMLISDELPQGDRGAPGLIRPLLLT
jgi:hypothetical protein